ncbi:hypothetical protein V3C99_006431 [Haemonchus contortus]
MTRYLDSVGTATTRCFAIVYQEGYVEDTAKKKGTIAAIHQGDPNGVDDGSNTCRCLLIESIRNLAL